MRAADLSFSNWIGSQRCGSPVVAPRSLEELQETVRRAARRGRVRAIGGRYAFAPLVPTTGTLVDMRHLGRCLEVDADPRGPTITVEAGMTMRRLSDVARLHGLTSVSPTVFGGITVGGAIATASHGSGRAMSTWSDQVVAMTVVDADGELVRIERDDPRLPAASAALGALGVVYAITIRVEPAFSLVFRQCALPVGETLDALPAIVDAHDFVETYWFPLAREMWLLTADRSPLPPRPRGLGARAIRAVRDGLTHGVGGGLMPIVSRSAPATTTRLLRLARYFTFVHGVEILPAPDAFHYHTAYPKVWDHSLATPLDRAGDAWRTVIELVEEDAARGLHPINFVAHARYLGPGHAWLSPTYGQPTCAIEVVTAPETPGALDHFARLQRRIFSSIPGSRPHWGKILVDPETSLARFDPGAVAAFLRERERFDPERVFLNPFLEREIFALPRHGDERRAARPDDPARACGA